jgi:alpha-L-fucosidase
LVTCATRGGNLLLNVGPDPSGLIEARQRARLAELGSWLAQFGESIRGTSGVAVSDGVWGGITRSEDSLYVHVLDWQGDDGVDVPIALRTAAPLEVLTGGTAVTEPLATGSRIVVRSEDPRPIDTIIRIRRTDVIDPFLGSSS